MNSVSVLDDCKCCLHGLPEHFVKEAKLLSCGHPACQICIKHRTNNDDEIQCSRCNKVDSSNMDAAQSVPMVAKIIESNLEHLSKALYSQINSAESEIEEFKNKLKDEINSKFEWIEGEIDIAIESMKTKLDDIHQSFKTKLQETKDKTENLRLIFDPIDEIKVKTETFNKDIQRNSFNLETFYDNNSNLLNIGLLLEQLKKFKLEVQFEFNEKFVLDEDSVGSFSCNVDDYIDKSLIDIVETGKPEYIELDYEPYGIVELKNKNILVSSLDDGFLALYDSKFKLIRKITEIDNKKIWSHGLACDQNGNVYFTNWFNIISLYKLDSELNSIKSICNGCFYADITIHKNKIYMCGFDSVRVYSLDLDEITKHHVGDVSMQISITTDMACVQFSRRTDENFGLTRFTRFYKLPSFELVIEHDLIGPILAHRTMFYMYHPDDTGFTVFDKNGRILKKIEKSLGKTRNDLTMRFFNNALHICLNKNKKICKIR